MGNLTSEGENHTAYVTDYDYDDLYRLIEIDQSHVLGAASPTSPGTSTERPSTTYEYDQGGNLVLRWTPLAGETSYEYDNLGCVIKQTLAHPVRGGAERFELRLTQICI